MEERGETIKSASSLPGLAERLVNMEIMTDVVSGAMDDCSKINLTFASLRLGG